MATTEDAQAGWELYLNSGFQLSPDQINGRLRALGFAEVSGRMFDHYRRLRRRGFRRYITINRLDTMAVPDPFADESIRSRYRTSEASVPAQVVVHAGVEQIELVAVADSLSDFGAELVVTDVADIAALKQSEFSRRSPVTVNFLSPAATVYGFLDFVSTVEPLHARIGVVFQNLVPVTQFATRQTLGTERFLFVVGTDGRRPSLDEVSQQIYWLFNLVESSRAIVNALFNAYSGSDLYVGPPAVEHLEVASPLRTWISINASVFTAIQQAMARLESVVNSTGKFVQVWSRRDLNDGLAERTRAQADLIRAEADGVRISNVQKQLVVDVLSTYVEEIIKPQIRMAGRQVRRNPSVNVESLSTLILNDFLPALEEVSARGLVVAPEPTDGSPAK
jgi:hypothetical protein